MRKTLLMMITIMLLSITTKAQFTTNAFVKADKTELNIHFVGTLDTLGGANPSLTSNLFDLADYDGVTNLTISYRFVPTAPSTAAKVSMSILRSDDDVNYNSVVGDTIISSATSINSWQYTSFTLGNTRAKTLKLHLFNILAGGNIAFDVYIRSAKRDY